MSMGRVLSAATASLAVAGCAVVAVQMSKATHGVPAAQHSRVPSLAEPTSRPAYPGAPTSTPAHVPLATSVAPVVVLPAPPRTPTARVPVVVAPRVTAAARATSARPAVTYAPVSTRAAAPRTAAHRTTAAPAPRPAVHRSTARPAPRAATTTGQALPLRYSTGTATRVITVVARSYSSTVATLQAWTKVSGGWRKYGSATTAHIGSDGMSSHPSESRSASPIGSFTLTRAFGHYSDPGTPLPYTHTTPSYWWISQAGRLYNTMQHCSSGCGFNRGSPNEHLYYETPYYNYAVVIDYNTRNAPGGVRQGAGSAFFLHVTDGSPTAGCVAISQSRLVSLMRWLRPSTHPRMLLGVR